ncbi:MAG: flavodoxin family protein [Candidatus Zhuqueibacterota bacterium]
MSILAFNGSPRKNSNSSILLKSFITGAKTNGEAAEIIKVDELNLEPCIGCLRCNHLKKCAQDKDAWPVVSQKILDATTIIFATPIYFHHMPSQLKKVVDRFRSFVHVQILEDGLKHTPWVKWHKNFVLLLTLGSPLKHDSLPILDLFKFICFELGTENTLSTICATRLAIPNQITMDKNRLRLVYEKMNIPQHLVDEDFLRNQQVLDETYQLGVRLTAPSGASV